jgi:hypothetical protein
VAATGGLVCRQSGKSKAKLNRLIGMFSDIRPVWVTDRGPEHEISATLAEMVNMETTKH